MLFVRQCPQASISRACIPQTENDMREATQVTLPDMARVVLAKMEDLVA